VATFMLGPLGLLLYCGVRQRYPRSVLATM